MEAALPAVISAVVALLVGLMSTRLSARGQTLTSENEQDRISLERWNLGQAELRQLMVDKEKFLQGQIDSLRADVEQCHREKDALQEQHDDEVGGMRTANAELRGRIVTLESTVRELSR